MHKDAKSADADFDWLLAKFDAGASEAITQFFFDAESFFRLRDRLDKFGLADRLIPGILAFDDISKMLGFAGHCGVCIPPALTTELEKSARTNLSAAHSLSVLLDLWLRLSAQGVDRYHIYTLNKAQPTQTLLELLGIPKHPDALPSCHKQTIMS
jgi:methylenetetrahydrofolate reductase (NADPH)